MLGASGSASGWRRGKAQYQFLRLLVLATN
jgi:hypothetical protein